MTTLMRQALLFSLLLVVLTLTFQQVFAATQHYSLNVPAGGRQQIQVNLRKSDVIQFYISAVTSNLGQDQIDFSIIGPNGQVVYSQSNVSTLRDSYMATSDGTYYLTFDNKSLLLAKTVEVDVTATSGSPCVIATAAYGSELAGPVQFLRNFRDEDVARTYLGGQFLQAFNAWYYSWAPSVAAAERQNSYLRDAIRVLMLPLLGSLIISSEIFQWLVPINGEVAILVAGLFASALIGLFYLSPFSIILARVSKRRITTRTVAYATILGMALTLVGTIVHGAVGVFQLLTAFIVIEIMLFIACSAPRLIEAAWGLRSRSSRALATNIRTASSPTVGTRRTSR